MRIAKLLLPILVCIFSGAALADSVTYNVTVNTSSIAGTSGSLDFQFNPGLSGSQAASVQIADFSGGTLGAATITGDVVGSLPGGVTIDNGTVFNDYFTGYTFGNALSFEVSLFGPALSSPDGTSVSGSAFAFSMFSDAAGTQPVLTNDLTDGFAATIGVNLDGSTTVATPSMETNVSTPEPSTVLLLGFGISTMLIRRRAFR